MHPQCRPAAEAGYDACDCPPGFGWGSGSSQCKAGSKTTEAEAAACQGTGVKSAPAMSMPDDGGATSTIIVVIIVLVAGGIAIAEATGKLRPKKVSDGGAGIYESSTNSVENPTSITAEL